MSQLLTEEPSAVAAGSVSELEPVSTLKRPRLQNRLSKHRPLREALARWERLRSRKTAK